VPCGPVNTVEEAFADPQVAEGEMILELDHPEFGKVREVASPIKISDTSIDHVRGPKLGEHTEQILSEYLNLSKQKITQLRTDGVI
jgi:crotonobetainyl-CoA:carnitine CoA-transferase CaiB-like acyl-CoA transferase